MKKRILAMTLIFAAAALITSCKHHINDNYNTIAPNPPTNVSVLALDNEVDISWDKSSDRNVAGYNVYYAYEYDGHYTLLGNTKNNFFVDAGTNGPVNGVKYYYAVAAYDYDGNESELSGTYAFAIPRPEGYNVSLYDYNVNPTKGGYDFRDYMIVPYSDQNNDMFFDFYNGKYYMDVWEDSDIKDMGPTIDITDISIAPVSGYVPLIAGDNIKYTEAIVGHTYVIRTWDNHFAKVRVSQIASNKVVFDWAYQLIKDERLLKEGAKQPRTMNFSSVIVNRK